MKSVPVDRSYAAVIAISLGIAAASWFVFGQTLQHEFVNYDDGVYVTANPQVRAGITVAGIAWAFTGVHARNWHPLTTISHMIDCTIYGTAPAGHHATNVCLHALAAMLLFLFLRRCTERTWSSAFVASVFAFHPLRVESVAWIAERKDVLSGVFFMLTLIAYARYRQKPTIQRYLVTSMLFACGLMAKPMLVTVPAILLLLDYWPFRQIKDARSFSRLLLEKLPLFGLAIAAGTITFLIQKRSFGAIAPLPFAWRTENALVSYVLYLVQMTWPADLAVFYPHPANTLKLWQVATAAVVLIAIAAAVFICRKRWPYLLVGWLWYLVMLLPVIGLVQVGLQGHADRYTYLPQIGIYLAATWLVVDLTARLRHRRELLGALAAGILLGCVACSRQQVRFWRNSETLWEHALAVTANNEVAQTNLGMLLLQSGQLDAAIARFQSALQIHLDDAHPHYNLSRALIHNDLGDAFARKDSTAQAIEHYRKAFELEPGYADAHYNLGLVLLQRGDVSGAIEEWKQTLILQPNDAEAHTSLAGALLQKGALRDAIAHYEKGVEAPAPSMFAFNNLAWILATCPDSAVRNGARASKLARRALQMSHGNVPTFWRTAAAAEAEAGDFEQATAAASHARELAAATHDVDLAREIDRDLDLYRANTPLRDPALKEMP